MMTKVSIKNIINNSNLLGILHIFCWDTATLVGLDKNYERAYSISYLI